MKKIVACLLTAGLALTALAPAEASGGCGPRAHRGPGGHCRPNYGRPVVARPFHGRGHFDNRRYQQNRHRDHGRHY